MLPNYFDYIFAHLRQKVRLRPELSPKLLSTLGPNPARTQPEKIGPTYYSGAIRIFANQFKRITRVKLRIFVLKVATSGPLAFLRT